MPDVPRQDFLMPSAYLKLQVSDSDPDFGHETNDDPLLIVTTGNEKGRLPGYFRYAGR